MLLLILLFLSVCMLFAYLYHQLQQDLLSPSVVMAGMFVLSILCAVLNADPWRVEYHFLAYFYIISGIFVFSLPSLYYQAQPVTISYVTRERYIDISVWKIVATAVINLLLIVLFWFEMKRVVVIGGYDGPNIQWAFRQLTSYTDRVQVSIFIRVFIRFLDVSAYLFGYTFIHNVLVYRNGKQKDWLLLSAPFLFVVKTVLSGGRLDVLKLLAAYIVIAYILQKRKLGWDVGIAKKYIRIGLGCVVIGLPVFYYTLFLTGRSTQRSLLQSVSTYLGGSIQHFNQYITNPVPRKGFLGEESLIAVLNLLGKLRLIPYHQAVHLEYRRLGVTQGNVYTFFRRPLHDFGPIGMYVFVFLVGLLFAYVYYKWIQHRKPSFSLDIVTVVYSYFFYWIFLSSIEQYSFSALSAFSVVFVLWMIALAYFYWKVDIDWKDKLRLYRLEAEEVVIERNENYD